MQPIGFNPFMRAPGGSGLTASAQSARAEAVSPGHAFESAARQARQALGAGQALLQAGEHEADRHAGQLAGVDTGSESEKAGAALEGSDLTQVLSSTLPAHPGTASGPPPGDFLVDHAEKDAQGVGPGIDRKHRTAPLPGDDEEEPPRRGKEGEPK